jgi:hypothetical protein
LDFIRDKNIIEFLVLDIKKYQKIEQKANEFESKPSSVYQEIVKNSILYTAIILEKSHESFCLIIEVFSHINTLYV